MDAVVATHPFHTLFFPSFHCAFPNSRCETQKNPRSKPRSPLFPLSRRVFPNSRPQAPGPDPRIRYFGTPRHMRVQTEIPWAGETMANAKEWEPDVTMALPEGTEYDDPKPPR